MSDPENLTIWTYPGATPTNLDHPEAIAIVTDTDGTTTLVVADTKHHRIVGFTLSGVNILVTILVGTGHKGFSGDGGPAANAELHDPSGITIAPDKSIIISDTKNNRIRRAFLDVDNIWKIETLAGNGKESFSGDGGLAIMAELNHPTGIAVSADGSIIFSDSYNNRIRRIYRNPIDGTQKIQTIAGTGEADYGRAISDRLAINANLSTPHGVAIDRNGDILIADTNNGQIQKLHHNAVGIWEIETVAGRDGDGESSGDGGLATEAVLSYPYGIACSKLDDSFVITETLGYQVRIVYRDPIDETMKIKTIVGTGKIGFSGDGGPATNATMNGPGGIAFTDQDEVVFCDMHNSRIRFIGFGQPPTKIFGQISNLHSYVENDDRAHQDEIILRKAKKREDAYNGTNERIRMLMASGWWNPGSDSDSD